jgi:hypothetical protein
MSRPGFIRGGLKHLAVVPRLVFTVRGWPHLLLDAATRKGEPYRLRSRSGANCLARPGTSDWWIFLEIFVFRIYSRVDQDIREASTIIDIGANVGLLPYMRPGLIHRPKFTPLSHSPKTLSSCRPT